MADVRYRTSTAVNRSRLALANNNGSYSTTFGRGQGHDTAGYSAGFGLNADLGGITGAGAGAVQGGEYGLGADLHARDRGADRDLHLPTRQPAVPPAPVYAAAARGPPQLLPLAQPGAPAAGGARPGAFGLDIDL